MLKPLRNPRTLTIAVFAVLALVLVGCESSDTTADEPATSSVDSADDTADETTSDDTADETTGDESTSDDVTDGTASEDVMDARTESLTIAITGYENNVTPLTISFGSFPLTHDLVNMVYDTLFWSTARDDPDPWLAESAEPSEDGMVWTVNLREGVVWHDGEAFTADDVAFTFDYYKSFSRGRYAHHVSEAPVYNRAEVVDDLTVNLFFDNPVSVFRSIPGGDLPILPEHIWASIEDPGSAKEMLPIGTGPYKMVEMVSDQSYVLAANDDYFFGEPLVGELILNVVPNPATAFAALRTGQVALAAGRNVPGELLSEFESLDDIELVTGNRFESLHLYINTLKEPLSDPQLRLAIDMAIDDQAVVDTILQGLGSVGRPSFTHPESPWALPEGDPAATARFDVAGAQAVLDAAGYIDTDDDGVRETPGGDPLTFEIMGSANEPQDLRTAQLVAQQLAEVGIDMSVLGLDPATVRQRRAPPADGGPANYDLRIGSLDSHAHADPDGLLYFFHSPGLGFGQFITGYANPAFDAVVEEASATGDNEVRKDLLADAQTILAEDTPIITLAYLEGIYAYRPDMYDNWVSDIGHGLFNKRSFLPNQ